MLLLLPIIYGALTLQLRINRLCNSRLHVCGKRITKCEKSFWRFLFVCVILDTLLFGIPALCVSSPLLLS